MAKCILFIGQSLGNAFCTWGSSSLTPHGDTHMWNGSGWSAPVGDGAINYANCLREALQEPIYLVNACVDGMPLLYQWYASGYWATCGAGSLVANAISKTLAALATVSCLALDRVEFWGCQSDAINNSYSNGQIYSGLQTMDAGLRAGLGDDFRLCIWPVGKVASGYTAPVIQGQMWFALAANAPSLGIEPGPASYDRASYDGTHLGTPAEYGWMGIRAARNAYSYFVAKANAADTVPHYGAGPVIESLLRHPNNTTQVMFAQPRVKNGYCLIPGSQWPNSDTTWSTGWGAAWAGGSHTAVPLSGAQIMGGWIKLYSTWQFTQPTWVSYQGERDCSAESAIYDTNMQWGDQGQPMLPLALGSMTSN